jgi:amidase
MNLANGSKRPSLKFHPNAVMELNYMRLSKIDDHTHYFFSASVAPVLTVRSGERVAVETRDASNGQIRPELNLPVDRTRLLPTTGPVAVEGARPGDAVSIHIERIDFVPAGYAWVRPGLGILSVPTDGPYYARRIEVTPDGVRLSDGLNIPLRPMVGIVGVGTPEEISTRFPGRHGGNLDCVDMGPGNTIWLPVLIPGAHVSLGDVHAAMGEGEVSGTGVEIEAEVTVTIGLHREVALDGPLVITPEKTVFIASAPDLLQAVRSALERAIQALVTRNRVSITDAYMTASIAGNARICQLVNGDVTALYELPKEVFTW